MTSQQRIAKALLDEWKKARSTGVISLIKYGDRRKIKEIYLLFPQETRIFRYRAGNLTPVSFTLLDDEILNSLIKILMTQLKK